MVKILWLSFGSSYMPRVHLSDGSSTFPHTHVSSSLGSSVSPYWLPQLGHFHKGSRVWISCFMRYLSSKLLTSLFTNGVPLSLISLLGIPNHVMMCSQMKFETTASVALFKGIASTHFVKCLVATRIHIWPLEGGLMGPMRSSPKCGRATG